MLRKISLVALISICCADDTRVPIPAKPVTYKSDASYTIKYASIYVTPNKVKTMHVFQGKGQVSVIFELPKVPFFLKDRSHIQPAWDYLYGVYSRLNNPLKTPDKKLIIDQKIDGTPFVDFDVTVGESRDKQRLNVIVRAMDPKNYDLTDKLIDNNIPLSSAFISGFLDEGEFYKHPELKEKLKNLAPVHRLSKFLTDDGYPNWQLVYSYIANVDFGDGQEQEIYSSYTPHSGLTWLIGRGPADSLSKLEAAGTAVGKDDVIPANVLKDYNISKEKEKEILTKFKEATAEKVVIYELREVICDLSYPAPPYKYDSEIIIDPEDNFEIVATSYDDVMFHQRPSGKLVRQKMPNGSRGRCKASEPSDRLRILFISKNPMK